ncbi:MAG: K(+)/H(+) antiporter NhaP [Candidatus Aerophobetes bacterium ADurb.Bin490]|nr:MAG: K(+)/H(+) antiporter NhaP [Candidatus Aerophobetes bacterium ADurb.Bin490]
MQYSYESLFFVAALLLLVSVVLSKASEKFGLPTLIIFMVIGMIAGSEGVFGIHFDDNEIAKGIGILALSMILFYGGTDTKWVMIKPVIKEGVVLATLGVVATAGITGYAVHILLKIPVIEALLLGAIVSSTDAAAVFSILRSKGINLKGNLKPLLELESGSNDPMAVFLTVGIIGVITASGTSALSLIPAFFVEMVIGLAAGFLFGRLMVRFINRINLEYDGLYPVLTMALVIIIFMVTTQLKGNGYLSVYVAGITLGNSTFIHKNNIIRFHDGVAWLMQIVIFLMLGLLVFPSKVIPVAGQGIIAGLVLIFIARPAAVFACLSFSKLSFKEKVMISWVGLRGAVPVILAIFPLTAGVPGAEKIFNIVFFIVLLSALFQGSTIAVVSRWLGLEEPIINRKKAPIEIDSMAGVNADLNEVMIPFGSDAVGKRLFEIGIPKGALVTLISRDEQFIIPDGGTVLESGDVMLVMADKAAVKTIERNVFVKKPAAEEKEKGGGAE